MKSPIQKPVKFLVATIVGLVACLQVQAQDDGKTYSFLVSAGPNGGHFFDERPFRVSNINFLYERDVELRRRLFDFSTFFSSLSLSAFDRNLKYGIALTFNDFFNSRISFDEPLAQSGFVEEHHLYLSLNFLYNYQVSRRLHMVGRLGGNYKRAYSVYGFEGYSGFTSVAQVLSRDFGVNIGIDLNLLLPHNLFLGLSHTYYYQVQREVEEYNPANTYLISLRLGYLFGFGTPQTPKGE